MAGWRGLMAGGESGVAEQVERMADRLARRRFGMVMGAGRPGRVPIACRGDTGRAEAPDAHTLFEIGSITKVFTALLGADGVVRGLWRLDTPVREMLPVGAVLPNRDGVEITLQHLATHTSGLPRSPRRLGLRDNLDYLRTGADPYAGLTEQDVLTGLRGVELGRLPGQVKPRYSNLGFGILGAAMCSATGLDYGSLVRDRICIPLGLRDTVVDDQMTPGQRERMAVGHRGRRLRAEPWPLNGIPGAGALRSTAVDMSRFLAAQVDPPADPLGDALRLTQASLPGNPADKGLGWHRAGDRTLWHNGGTGGFRSIAIITPHRGLITFALVNQTRGADLSAFRLMRRLDA